MAKRVRKKASKKAAKKPPAKPVANAIAPQEPLPGMEDNFEIPVEVFEARKLFETAAKSAKTASKKKRDAKIELIDAMRRNDMDRLALTNGEEDFIVSREDKLQIKKRKKSVKKKKKQSQ